MAKILADKDVRKLMERIVVNGTEELLNPNGIELRLGKSVLFHTTGEESELSPGKFLKVCPGETVSISSIESIDFSAETVHDIFPGFMLMGFITPTTTMMREGISQVATKIDAGYRGTLNWGLRNGSTKDLILQYGEPIFKLTLFLLDKDESPEAAYGERPSDHYQDSEGIKRSERRIPADIPASKIVSSSFHRMDPRKRLQEAGHPFNFIGTELTALDGKIEVVSADMRLMKEELQRQTSQLSGKIEAETNTLSGKIESSQESVLEKAESLFDRKFLRVTGVIIGVIPILYAGVTTLQGKGLSGSIVAFIAAVVGLGIVTLTYLLSRKH